MASSTSQTLIVGNGRTQAFSTSHLVRRFVSDRSFAVLDRYNAGVMLAFSSKRRFDATINNKTNKKSRNSCSKQLHGLTKLKMIHIVHSVEESNRLSTNPMSTVLGDDECLYAHPKYLKYIEMFMHLYNTSPMPQELANELDHMLNTGHFTSNDYEFTRLNAHHTLYANKLIHIRQLMNWSYLKIAQLRGDISYKNIWHLVKQVKTTIPLLRADGVLLNDVRLLSFWQFAALTEQLLILLNKKRARPLCPTCIITLVSSKTIKMVVSVERSCRVIIKAFEGKDIKPTIHMMKSEVGAEVVEKDIIFGENLNVEMNGLKSSQVYSIFLYGECNSTTSAAQEHIHSSDGDVLRSVITVETKKFEEPNNFPKWDDLDCDQQSIEIAAISNDEAVRAASLVCGLNIPNGVDDISDQAKMFIEWWRHSKVRDDFCLKEAKLACRNSEVRAAALQDGVAAFPSDWDSKKISKISRCKIFCGWYFGTMQKTTNDRKKDVPSSGISEAIQPTLSVMNLRSNFTACNCCETHSFQDHTSERLSFLDDSNWKNNDEPNVPTITESSESGNGDKQYGFQSQRDKITIKQIINTTVRKLRNSQSSVLPESIHQKFNEALSEGVASKIMKSPSIRPRDFFLRKLMNLHRINSFGAPKLGILSESGYFPQSSEVTTIEIPSDTISTHSFASTSGLVVSTEVAQTMIGSQQCHMQSDKSDLDESLMEDHVNFHSSRLVGRVFSAMKKLIGAARGSQRRKVAYALKKISVESDSKEVNPSKEDNFQLADLCSHMEIKGSQESRDQFSVVYSQPWFSKRCNKESECTSLDVSDTDYSSLVFVSQLADLFNLLRYTEKSPDYHDAVILGIEESMVSLNYNSCVP